MCIKISNSSTYTQPNLNSYSNFIVCSVSDFLSPVAFISHHVYFDEKFLELIIWSGIVIVVEWTDTYGVFTTEIFFLK